VGALGVAVIVTGPKLYQMARIKGWLGGANSQERVIVEKWNQTPDQHPRGRDTYWISLTEDDIRKRGPHRLNLEPEQWRDLQVGDKIEVVYLPGDPEPYLRDGIYTSWGNFAFDFVLLGLELGVASAMAWALWRGREPKQGRA